MASSYTTSLKIQQISTGEQSGSWGTSTNSNWTLAEQAIAGVQSIVMSNANYTLSNLNGTLDEARNALLVVTGVNNATYQIIAPLGQPKLYTISNQTTGTPAYPSITIGASSGAIIIIPNGVTAQVYTDGTNFYAGTTGSAGNFLVNGNFSCTGSEVDVGNMTIGGTLTAVGATTLSNTLAVTGVTTFTAAPVLSALTASSSVATDVSKNLVSVANTGTGSNVLSVSPTFTGTPLAPTAAPGTNTTQIATTAFVTANPTVITGSIQMWPTASAPTGYLLCDGSSLSTTTYAALFAIVAYTFGGSGASFNLPNYTNRMPYGTTIGAVGGSADAVVVSHNHTAASVVTDPGHFHNFNGNALEHTGATYGTGNNGNAWDQFPSTLTAITGITVATTNTAVGVSGTNANLPPYLGISFIIKT
jgi:microcystin-dependent protein